MSKRLNHYHIKISFDKKRTECSVGNIYAKYMSGKENQDSFHFLSDSFTIIASRSKTFDDGTILSNNINSINSQILKGLLYYYSLANDFPIIKDVSIIRKRAKREDYHYSECKTDIIQPIINQGKFKLPLQKDKLNIIFEETEKGNAIRIALSYWLKGIASTERYYKFDHLWRAYNRLFMYQGNDNKEVECMAKMRTFIIQNENIFPNTLSLTNAYNNEDLRSFRWRNLILNDYSTIKKTKAFCDFILRYHDVRIMNLLNEMLVYREDFLNQENLLGTVQLHFLSNKKRYDIEMIPLLTIKYSYFVRNKMFHGEIPDSTFKIHNNNEDIEIDKLNDILSSLICELINNNDKMR